MIDNLRHLPPPKELTEEQCEHWEAVLENSERMAENARRILGRLATERGIE